MKKISNKNKRTTSTKTIKIAKTDNGAVVIAGLNNLQYDVINDLIMSWNIVDYQSNEETIR